MCVKRNGQKAPSAIRCIKTTITVTSWTRWNGTSESTERHKVH